MAGDGGWVGGLVELEVLGVVGGLLLLRVVLGHVGPGYWRFFWGWGWVGVGFLRLGECEEVVSKL